MIYAALATIPEREEILRDVVASLSPQVDKLFIYLNGHESTPEWFSEIENLEYVHSRDHGDHGDAGKFFWCANLDGVFLTCDDDIIYPETYAMDMVGYLESLSYCAVVTLHGAVMPRGAIDYHRSKRYFPLQSNQLKSRQVHIGGTGCMAFHTSTIRPMIDWFPLSNMADIWMAQKCQDLKIPIMMKKHIGSRFRCLKTLGIYHSTSTKDQSTRDRSEPIDSIIKATPWRFPALPPSVTI
jgi:hypothetical protein